MEEVGSELNHANVSTILLLEKYREILIPNQWKRNKMELNNLITSIRIGNVRNVIIDEKEMEK